MNRIGNSIPLNGPAGFGLKNSAVEYESTPNSEAVDTKGWPHGLSQLKLRRGGDTKRLIGTFKDGNTEGPADPGVRKEILNLLYQDAYKGLYMHGRKGPWMDQPLVAPDTEQDSPTRLHENIHANQQRYNVNTHTPYMAYRAYRHYIKQARTTFGEINKEHNTSRSNEANAYYAQQYRTAAEHKALLNKGWEGEENAPYYAYLANTEPGAYMLPRKASFLERMQDAIAKARQ